MLGLYNVTIELLNVRKSKGTTKCDKSTVACKVGTAQYEDDTIKCEKNKGTTECNKKKSYVMLVLHNMGMISSNVRKK